MGTPEFAADILEGLLRLDGISVSCVYTQPDRPAGRGKKLQPSPVKVLAEENNIPVRQPASLKGDKGEEELAVLQSLEPDFLVVAAYGMLLPESVLAVPRFAPINIHTSLLPKYRGCAPVQRAIMDGEAETGVSIMRMEAGLDTGPVYAGCSVATARETSGSLLKKMAQLSLPLLENVLAEVRAGKLEPVPQQGESSYAAKIQKADGLIDVFCPAAQADCHIRAVTPDPGAHVTLSLASGDVTLVLEEAVPVPFEGKMAAGEVYAKKGKLLLACQDGCLDVKRVRPQGKKSMDVASFLNGQRLGTPELALAGRIQPLTGK